MALDTQAVMDGIFAEAAKGDLESVLGWWHDDGTLEDVTLGQAFTGKAALRDYLDMYFRCFAELRYEPVRRVIAGPTALVEWMETTTVTGTFDGVDADGRTLQLHAVDVFHVVDGKVAHEVSWYGDGYLRARLLGDPGLPAVLPLTPPLAGPGSRFGADGSAWRVSGTAR